MNELSTKQIYILMNCIDNMNWKNKISENNISSLTSEELQKIQEKISDELVKKGLNQDYSTNEYGDELEDLIDRIGELYIYRDDN